MNAGFISAFDLGIIAQRSASLPEHRSYEKAENMIAEAMYCNRRAERRFVKSRCTHLGAIFSVKGARLHWIKQAWS